MNIEITLGEGKVVNAKYKGQIIKTDQSIKNGGQESAPEPFSLFLASIGTCSGIYVKTFCDQRNIPTENIRLTQNMSYNLIKRLIDKIDIEIHLPADFPEKYIKTVKRAVDQCSVKKHLLDSPEITVSAKISDS